MPSTDNERAAIPLYKEDFRTARARNETEIAAASIKMNDLCAKDISETINSNYSDNILNTDKIVDELVEKYGAERLAYIFAARITNADWDGRYSREAKAWAAQEISGLSEALKNRSSDYSLTAHPVLVNAVVEKFITVQREREKEQSAVLNEAMPDQASADAAYPSAKERLQELTDMLESGIRDVFSGDKFKEMLEVMSKFHDYSVNNTILIARQMPDATVVAGFNQWKKDFGRSVLKGAKGIKILAPNAYKAKVEEIKRDPVTDLPIMDKDGNPVKEVVEETRMSFKPVTVFDVSQTDGKPLPDLGVDELKGEIKDFDKLMDILRDISPVPINFAPIRTEAKGFYDPTSKSITIKEGMSDVQTVKTAIHEITHAKLHDLDIVKAKGEKPKDQSTKEVEAESVAFAVCQHFGIDTSDYSFGYVASWSSGKDTPELKASLETIHDTAAEIIKVISEKFLGIEKDKALEQEANYIGNTNYADIPQRQYQRLYTDTALDVAAKLEEMGIPYSGRITSDYTTLTYGKADAETFKAVLEEVRNARKGLNGPQIIGNAPFRDIADKRYLKLKNDVADKVAEQLYAEDIPFSGKVVGGYTTITVNREDELRCSAIAKGLTAESRSDIIGNVKFGDIKDKVYFKLEPEIAEKVASKLNEMGVSFSGKLGDDKTTITIDKADTKAYNAAVKEVVAAERKQPERSDIIGNTPYRLIAEKSYRKVSLEDMQAVSDTLTALGVKFSGQIKDDSVTFTVSKPDVPKIDAAIDKANGIRMINEQEEKKPARTAKAEIIGNTDFKSIPFKTYTGIPTSDVEAVVGKLNEMGIKFSGRIDGETTKLTTSKTDAKKLSAIIAEVSGISEVKETAAEKAPAKKSNIIGNTPYRSIPDPKIIRVPTSGLDELAKRLEEMGVKFSGVKGRDKSAITVTKADTEKVNEAIKDIGGFLEDTLKPYVPKPAKEPEKPFGTVKTSEIIGNTPYKEIAQKVYEKFPTEMGLAVAKLLDEKGARFSGHVKGEFTTLTVEKADIELLDEAMADYRDQFERPQPEKKELAAKSEHTPVYRHDLEYARRHNETPALAQSNRTNRVCSFEINRDAEKYAASGKLGEFAAKIAEKYGIERSMYVLSRNVQQNTHNQHSEAAKAIAATCKVGDPSMNSVIMTDVKPETMDALLIKLNEMQLERGISPEKPEYTGKIPDETVTIEDMNDYGYSYEGMLPLSAEKALEMYDNDLAPVYLLWEDNSESMANSRQDIEEHDGMFGVEVEDWEKVAAYQEHLESLAASEPSREAMLLNDNKCMVGIYQLKSSPENHGIAFAPMKELEQQGVAPDRDNYTLVYTFEVHPEELENLPEFLDDVYGTFNYDRPEDFKGHSLSVSDVIVVNNHGEKTAVYVDSWDMKPLEVFGQVRENPLKAVEDALEQNDNNFDGIINNLPTVDEITKRAESGQQVSLMDLANAMKREQEQGQKPAAKGRTKAAKPEQEKKSVLGFLKQAAAAKGTTDKKEPTKARAKTKGTEI